MNPSMPWPRVIAQSPSTIPGDVSINIHHSESMYEATRKSCEDSIVIGLLLRAWLTATETRRRLVTSRDAHATR